MNNDPPIVAMVEALCDSGNYWQARAEKAEAEAARLRKALSLIAIVEQGCGGNLTFKEMAESAMSQARAALQEGGR